jgi:hypothetical protein
MSRTLNDSSVERATSLVKSIPLMVAATSSHGTPAGGGGVGIRTHVMKPTCFGTSATTRACEPRYRDHPRDGGRSMGRAVVRRPGPGIDQFNRLVGRHGPPSAVGFSLCCSVQALVLCFCGAPGLMRSVLLPTRCSPGNAGNRRYRGRVGFATAAATAVPAFQRVGPQGRWRSGNRATNGEKIRRQPGLRPARRALCTVHVEALHGLDDLVERRMAAPGCIEDKDAAVAEGHQRGIDVIPAALESACSELLGVDLAEGDVRGFFSRSRPRKSARISCTDRTSRPRSRRG